MSRLMIVAIQPALHIASWSTSCGGSPGERGRWNSDGVSHQHLDISAESE